MRVLVLGDTHGNTAWLADYVYPTAARLGVDAIVQVGDFGFWEHTRDGVDFLDELESCACEYGIPLFALHGNHDKWSLVMEKYANQVDEAGFIRCRAGVYYIPQGHIWEWEGVRMRSFGGAYSIDKDWRLELEGNRARKLDIENDYRRRAGKDCKSTDTRETLWFPEEEMSDEEMAELLVADSSKLDIIFSHDKPRGSNPDWNRKDFEECWPNQDRLQRALVAHQPSLWFHGHLHYAYEDLVRAGDDDTFTRVMGLGPDNDAAPPRWRRTDSWCVLDLGDSEITMTSGAEMMQQINKEAA